MGAHLAVHGLDFAYAGRPVLQGVSAGVARGEILGLIGPNGAGKSTLVKAVLGLVRPQAGEILLDGKPLSGFSPRQRARRIGYVPQSSPANFPVTVFEVCLLGRTPHMGMAPGKRDIEIVETLLARLDLLGLAFRTMSELSGGERQRVMLARALAQETEMLVLDEPTSALDIGNQLFTLRVVSEIARERGVTVVVAIHDLSLAARFTDRLLLLDKGRVAAEGGWRDTLTRDTIRAVYGVGAEIGMIREVPVFVPYEVDR